MKRYDTYKDSGIEWIGEITGYKTSKSREFIKTGSENGPARTRAQNYFY
jgi:hypothetical protein